MPRGLKEQILDLVFPCECLGCGAPGEVICLRCLAGLAVSRDGRCADEPGLAGCWPAQGRLFGGMRAAGLYQGLLKEAVLALKSSQRPLASPLSALMVAASGNDPDYIAPDVVCFVPSTREKTRRLGYNPAELLARAVSRRIARPAVRALVKTRATRDQDGLPREARLVNVTGAFEAETAAVSGRRVLLVDDVFTTGATAQACSEALLDAGAGSVHVLVAAHAVVRSANGK